MPRSGVIYPSLLTINTVAVTMHIIIMPKLKVKRIILKDVHEQTKQEAQLAEIARDA